MSNVTPLNKGSWGTQGSDYSPDQFYTRSTDGHGQYRHLRVNLPPETMGQLAELVAKDKIPEYRTAQDVARDAITHRLKYLNDTLLRDPSLERAITALIRLGRMEAIQREAQELAQLVETSRDTLDLLARSRDWDAVEVTLDEAKNQAEEIRDPYRDQMHDVIKEFERKYETELKGVRK